MTGASFGRNLRLIVANAVGAGVDLGGLSCRFEVERVPNGVNRAHILVFNLHADTQAELAQRHTQVRLEAGYAGTYSSIFEGQIKNVFPSQEGPDGLTEIFASDAGRALRGSFVNLKFGEGTDLHSILTTVVSTFNGVQMGSLLSVTNAITVGPRVEVGPTRGILDQLARSFGFSWSIQNGIFQAFDIGSAKGAQIVNVSRETGMIGTPLASTTGTEVVSLLNPEIRPGGLVNIDTAGARVAASSTALTTAPGLQLVGARGGLFVAYRVTHIGETRGQTWYTRAECLRLGALTSG